MISVAHKVCNSMAVTYLLQTVTPWRGGSSLWSGCFCFVVFVVIEHFRCYIVYYYLLISTILTSKSGKCLCISATAQNYRG